MKISLKRELNQLDNLIMEIICLKCKKGKTKE